VARLLEAVFNVRRLARDSARFQGRPWLSQVEVAAGDYLRAGELPANTSRETTLHGFRPYRWRLRQAAGGHGENLIKPENKEKLLAIHTYHVVSAKVMAADLQTMKAKSVNGRELSIKVEDGTLMVDNATVIKTDGQQRRDSRY
jgi:hypothetical protein